MIILREDKGTPLEHIELDNNFKFPFKWKPNKLYKEGQRVYNNVNNLWNIYIAKNDIQPSTIFNLSEWYKIGNNQNLSFQNSIQIDTFTYNVNLFSNSVTLTKPFLQFISFEINGDDRILGDDVSILNNIVTYNNITYPLETNDKITIKYVTQENISVTNLITKTYLEITPLNTTPITLTNEFEYYGINTNISNAIINLPLGCDVGTHIQIFDSKGILFSLAKIITINGNIENQPTTTMTNNFQTINLLHIGNDLWKII